MKIHRFGAMCAPLLLWLGAGAAAQDAPTAPVSIFAAVMTSDIQVAADGSSTQTLHAEIRAGNDASAPQVGQASFPYDSESQDLSVTEAHTLKADGRSLPVDSAAIYDQAPNGREALVTSVKSKLIVFPQFAAGDTAVYTIKIVTRHPSFEKQFVFAEVFPRTVAYGDVRETITAPKSFPLYIESHDVDASKRDDGANVIYSWHYSAPTPLAEEPVTLFPLDHTPRFFVTSFKDYAELGRAYAALVSPKRLATPKIIALADQITAGISDPRLQTQKLYEWVSTNIRYVAIELGAGSFTPHDVDLIVANGYGDCKDHDILLQSLLKAKGIEAQSILINATASYTLTDVATYTSLDHVITYVPQFNLYLDSTAQVAPFGILPMQEYGKPMVVADAAAARRGTMPLLAPGLAKITTKSVQVIDADGNLTGTTTTTASGPYAITLRFMGLGIQAVGPGAATRLLTASGYSDASGSFTQNSPAGFTPDFTIASNFKTSGWKDILTGKNSFLMPGGLRLLGLSGEDMMGPFNPGRLKPDEPTLCFSAQASEDLSLQAPPGIQFDGVPKDTHVQTPNLEFTAHWSLNGNTLSVHRDFTSKIDQQFCTGSVRTQAAAALKQISDSYDNTAISFRERGQNSASAAPDPAEILYNQGVSQSDAGQYADAIANLDKAIALKPDYADAYYSRGTARYGAGDMALAIADYSKSIELNPDEVAAYHARGLARLKTKEYSLAAADFDKAIALKPDYAEAYSDRSLTYSQSGQYDRAMADLDKAIALKPDLALAYFNRGVVHSNLKQYTDAIANLDKAIALKPDYADAYYSRGTARYGAGDMALAIADYSKSIELNPDDVAAYYARGLVRLKTEEYSLASADFDKAIALKPDYAEAYSDRSLTYSQSGQYDRAMADLDKAIALKPDFALAYFNRGVVHSNLKQYALAVADDDSAITLKPDFAAAYFNRGQAHNALQQFPAAIGDLNKIIALTPENRPAYLQRALVESNMRQYPAALADFDKVIAMKPDDFEAFTYRGQTFIAQHQYTLAITDLDKAIALQPNNSFALFERGHAYLLAGYYTLAVADLDKVIVQNPNNTNAYLYRGDAKTKLGQKAEGDRDIATAIKLDPSLGK